MIQCTTGSLYVTAVLVTSGRSVTLLDMDGKE